MRGTLTLPDGYAGLCSIDLQKDKRLALLINGLALLIALPVVFLGNRIVLLRTLFSMDDGFGFYFLRLGMLITDMRHMLSCTNWCMASV